jgi:hypothetical protein
LHSIYIRKVTVKWDRKNIEQGLKGRGKMIKHYGELHKKCYRILYSCKNRNISHAILFSYYDFKPIVKINYSFFTVLFSLENDWRNIVENSELLSEKQQQQQTALWELAQTEVAYIKTLKVVTDVSMSIRTKDKDKFLSVRRDNRF